MRTGRLAVSSSVLRHHSRHGAITIGTLETLGVPSRTAYRRCVPGGPWQRPLPGIALLTNEVPTRRQLVEAALLYAGEDAVLTGAEACRRHGLRAVAETATVHLLISHARRLRSADYVEIERTKRHPKHIMIDGLPVAPVVRAVLDACRRMKQYNRVRALIAEAVQRRRVTPGLLAHELETGSQRGTAIPREVLRDIDGGARSVAEIDAMRVWERTGLPPLEWNVDVVDASGTFVARPDGWCDEVALAWEIDSREFHFNHAGYDRTLKRNARYAAAGIAVVQTVPSRLRLEPEAVVAELRAAHNAARARPRPPVAALRPQLP